MVCTTQPLPRIHDKLVEILKVYIVMCWETLIRSSPPRHAQIHAHCASLTILTTVSQDAHEAAGIMGARAYTDYARILQQDATRYHETNQQ